MARQFFGTDGVRGRVGDLPMHPEWVLRLGWAAGHVLTAGAQGRPRVVIGKDTRLSGYLLESALESGLAAAGVDVLLVGPLPTPAIAYLTRTLRADAGIVISASHNPFPDNGIKFFSGDGLKLADEIEEAIEARMKANFEQNLEPLLKAGVIGFTADGNVAVRDLNAAPLSMRAGVSQAVASANRERGDLYAAIARANGHPEWEPRIRAVFAQTWIQKARPGWYYRDSSGAWQRKP
jgi:phosphomannomutase